MIGHNKALHFTSLDAPKVRADVGRKMIDETYEMCESIRHEHKADIADG